MASTINFFDDTQLCRGTNYLIENNLSTSSNSRIKGNVKITPGLINELILDKTILGVNSWKKAGILVDKDVPPFPVEGEKWILDGKASENRVIVLIPKGCSEEKIGFLFKQLFPHNKNGFKRNDFERDPTFKSEIEHSYWIGLKAAPSPDSYDLSYQEAVEKYQRPDRPMDRLAKRVEVEAAALLMFCQTGETILAKHPIRVQPGKAVMIPQGINWHFTWCQGSAKIKDETVRTAVGNFTKKNGLSARAVVQNWQSHLIGVVSVHEFR